ncbi:hypothetical protein GGI21_004703, partial [Coemansia aciculifera]
MEITAHCQKVIDSFPIRLTKGDAKPVYGYVCNKANEIGLSFSSEAVLLLMIAHPPSICGKRIFWSNAKGEIMYPIVLVGAPLAKMARHVRAALRTVCSGVEGLTQDTLFDAAIGDWSAIIYVEEGLPLPSAVQFSGQRASTPILPAHIAVRCPSCYHSNPALCACAAPQCHHTLVATRLAAQEAALQAAAAKVLAEVTAAIDAAQAADKAAESMLVDSQPGTGPPATSTSNDDPATTPITTAPTVTLSLDEIIADLDDMGSEDDMMDRPSGTRHIPVD